MADGVGCFGKTQKKNEKSLKKERLRNSKILLGDIRDIHPSVRRLYELGLPENLSKCGSFFAPFESTPEEFDKLRFQRQTFPQWKVQREFQKLHYRQRLRLKKRKIYILPIGPFPSFVLKKILGLASSLFELLSNFVSVFYAGFSVEMLEVKDLGEIPCQTRVHPGTGKLQILVGDVLSYLKEHRPRDGFCIIGISWQDLYPGDEWNFVLGEASSEDGCAAISFGHYEPKPSEKLSTLRTLTNDKANYKASHKANHDEMLEGNAAKSQNFDSNKLESSSSVEKKCVNNPHLTRNENGIIDDKIDNDNLIKHSKKDVDYVSSKKKKETDDFGNLHGQESNTSTRHRFINSKGEKSSGQKECSDLENNSGRTEKIDVFEIWKFFRVVSHELGHIFGITHCSYFSCAMNESTTIAEAVNQPLFMCPVCLRKIQKAVGFGVVERYSRLQHFLETLHSDLLQGLRGKHDNNSDHIPGAERNDIDNSFGRELEKLSKAVDWIDSVLNFLKD
ncbi:archaemetzincin-2-like isoform X2 [Actinia tenebrosa]|uniref:Archaemetzincin-2-like isoform X2 n=1 Tax=Actinia tenebrosa TaxID=6105 RepID=A0A6P8H8W9_ACTTE|nr:archaemetzincin-2-like isoform X2 [Actinia tenebrosa]